MAYQRTRRINEEIKKVISTMLFEGQIKDKRINTSKSLISVTSVDVVKDLRYAYVYISVLGNDSAKVLEGLQKAAGYVRRAVGQEINLRYTPEIVFRLDDSIAKGAYMSKLINDLHIKHEEPAEEIIDEDEE